MNYADDILPGNIHLRPDTHPSTPKSGEYSLPSAAAGHVKVFIRHVLDVEKKEREPEGDKEWRMKRDRGSKKV